VNSVIIFEIQRTVVRRKDMNAVAETPMSTEPDLESIYREHYRKVYNLCAYLLNSGHAAEDAAHEVFLRVHRNIGTFNPDYSPSNWIMKIASNYCMDLLRKRGRERRLFWLVPGMKRAPLADLRGLLTSGGIGFVVVVATPVAAIILAITVVGLPVALVSFLFWLLALYLAKIVVGRFIGGWLLKNGNDSFGADASALIIGLLIVIIAVNLPFIGGILNFLLTLIGLGALLVTAFRMFREKRAAIPVNQESL
jgi:uncharacterized membrane protein